MGYNSIRRPDGPLSTIKCNNLAGSMAARSPYDVSFGFLQPGTLNPEPSNLGLHVPQETLEQHFLLQRKGFQQFFVGLVSGLREFGPERLAFCG
jgi:hypothetical protein